MLDFILQISIVLSLSVIIYLFARALPRVGDAGEAKTAKKNYFENFLKKLPLQKIDASVSAFLEKILRKLRVVLLKIENTLDSAISRLRKGSNGSANPGDASSKKLFDDKK